MLSTQELLAGVPIFAGLSPKELKKLVKDAHEVSFPAGTHLTDDEDFGTMFFVVREGELDVSVHEQLVRTVGPGDYLGEMALIDKETRSATVVARVDTACVVFTRPVFRPFAYSHPEVAWALLEAMVARVREAEAR